MQTNLGAEHADFSFPTPGSSRLSSGFSLPNTRHIQQPSCAPPPKIADCFSMFVYFRSLLILVRHCQTVSNPPPSQLSSSFSSHTFLRKIQHPPPADSPGIIHSKFCRVLYHLVTFMKIYRSQGGGGGSFAILPRKTVPVSTTTTVTYGLVCVGMEDLVSFEGAGWCNPV